MESKKSVLIISCYFPPMGGSGVQRTTKFVKYLCEFGWHPIVLTTEHPLAASKDQTLLREVPEHVKVVRTKHFDIAERYAKAEEKKTPAIKTSAQTADAKKQPAPGSEESAVRKFMKWLKAPLRRVVNFPDRKVGWLPWAFPAALKIIREHKPKLIYISGDPFSTFLMAPFLKFLTRTPYVLDFRDEWTACLSAPGNIFGREKSNGLEEWLEKWVIRNACKVISVTDTIIENFRRRYPQEPAEKFTCIENGYDAADFEGEIISFKPAAEKKFTISYVGMLGSLHFEPNFFQAVKELADENPSFAKNARARFVGRVWDSLKAQAKSYECAHLEFQDYLPHAQAVQCLRESDVLLVMLTSKVGMDRAMSGKIYEYIAARKPILAVAPEGQLTQFLQKYPRGIHAPAADKKSIKAAIERLFLLYQEGSLNSHFDLRVLPEFERRTQAGQLAEVFNGIVSKKFNLETCYA